MKRVLISTGFKEYGYTNLANVLASFDDIEVVLFSGLILPKSLVSSRFFVLIKKIPFFRSMNFRFVDHERIRSVSNALLEIVNWVASKYNFTKVEKWSRYRYKINLSNCIDKGCDFLILRPGFCPIDHNYTRTYVLLGIPYPEFIIEEFSKIGRYSGAFSNEYWLEIKEDLIKAENIIVNSRFIEKTFPIEMRNKNFLLLFNPIQSKILTRGEVIRVPESICFVGEIGYRKGFDRIIEVFEKFCIENITFHIIGAVSEEMRKDFEEFLRVHGRKNNFIYLKSSDKLGLSEIYRRSDFFLFPTRAEGSSRALIEAMIEGCIPITSEYCGVELTNGINSVVYTSWNENFVLDSFYKTRNSRTRLREEAERIGEVYSTSTYLDQVRKISESFV